MAPPTTVFRTWLNSVATTALDTAAERLGSAYSPTTISTGAGNELDFGTVDISGGAAFSAVKHASWHCTADGGNTTVEDFRLWMSSNGFDIAGSICKMQPLSGGDQGTPSATENYATNATEASYTWDHNGTPDDPLDESLPSSQNVFPSDEGTSMALSTGSDDIVFWALILSIASGETTGTYKGTDTGYELQFSFRYTYS